MDVAKVFTNGRSQAVRLPKSCRFQDDEVLVNRIGSMVILMPKGDPWAGMIKSLDMFTDDFMEDGRGRLNAEARESL